MEDLLNQIAANLLPFFLLFCVVPLLLTGIAIFLLIRQLNRLAAPDISRVTGQFDRLRRQNPRHDDIALVRRIVRGQAFRAGVVGGVTSLGGFWTLPIALPVDMALSTQIQATMVEFIARHYGHVSDTTLERQVRSALITRGSSRLTESTVRVGLAWATRITGKSFAKLIPILGAVIGFAVNYAIAQATGEIALRYYQNKPVDSPSLA